MNTLTQIVILALCASAIYSQSISVANQPPTAIVQDYVINGRFFEPVVNVVGIFNKAIRGWNATSGATPRIELAEGKYFNAGWLQDQALKFEAIMMKVEQNLQLSEVANFNLLFTFSAVAENTSSLESLYVIWNGVEVTAKSLQHNLLKAETVIVTGKKGNNSLKFGLRTSAATATNYSGFLLGRISLTKSETRLTRN